MRNTIFTIASKVGLTYLLKNAKGESITVVSLHRISEDRNFFFDPIDPKTFEAFIAYCVKHYTVISFAEINRETQKPKLILSFDDGYYDFIEYAVPVLVKYDLPSNHNLVNACLNSNSVIWTQKLNDIFSHLKSNSIINDETIHAVTGGYSNDWTKYYMLFFLKLLTTKAQNRNEILGHLETKYDVRHNYKMMNWADAKLCKEKFRVEIGSHTYNHDSLSTLTTDTELEMEIGKSINEMEEKLNTKIDIIALPNGQSNESVVGYCKRKGIKYMLLVDDKVNIQKKINGYFNLISRVYLVNESIDEMIFRTELFHSKARTFI